MKKLKLPCKACKKYYEEMNIRVASPLERIWNNKKDECWDTLSQQRKKDVGTLSNSLSGDPKQSDTKLQIERSASLPVENHSAERNFIWALYMLKQGKKVRRHHWNRYYFLKMNIKGNILQMNTNNSFPLKYQTTQGKDWELYEEKPKIIYNEPVVITPLVLHYPKNTTATIDYDDKFNLWRVNIVRILKQRGGKNARIRTKKIRRKT